MFMKKFKVGNHIRDICIIHYKGTEERKTCTGKSFEADTVTYDERFHLSKPCPFKLLSS